MQKVVGLVGLRGSGKDTAAQVLVERGWRRLAFADALYVEVATAFGVTIEFLQRRETKETPLPELSLQHCSDAAYVAAFMAYEGDRLAAEGADIPDAEKLEVARSPREILQGWGTEYRRKQIDDSYWRTQVFNIIKATPDVNFVVTDVRFPDEAKLIEEQLGGQLGRIIRPGQAGDTDKALAHASETAMRDYPIALEFINDEGPVGLERFQQAVLTAYL